MPRVSVIVPAFNAGAYLDEAIAGVVAQSADDWELTVVDDGSTDGSGDFAAEWARRDPRVRLLRQASSGEADVHIAGFAALQADGDSLLFLDADDRLEPEALDVMSAYLDDHPDVGMVHCGYIRVDER